MIHWRESAYATTPVAATSEHVSAVDSFEQGSREGWRLPRSQAIARGGAEFGRAHQRRTGENPAGAAIEGLAVAPALPGRGSGRFAGRVSVGWAFGAELKAATGTGSH